MEPLKPPAIAVSIAWILFGVAVLAVESGKDRRDVARSGKYDRFGAELESTVVPTSSASTIVDPKQEAKRKRRELLSNESVLEYGGSCSGGPVPIGVYAIMFVTAGILMLCGFIGSGMTLGVWTFGLWLFRYWETWLDMRASGVLPEPWW